MEEIDGGVFLNALTECATMASNYLDADNEHDNRIILGLIECCEIAVKVPYKKKRSWVKPCREEGADNSFSYINEMEALGTDGEAAEHLLSIVKADLTRKNTVMRGAIPPEKRLAGILISIMTGESYKIIDAQIGLSSSFLCSATPEVCEVIWKKLKEKYLSFPSSTMEWESIAEEFAIKRQFPNCLGALDGKHVSFKGRRTDAAYYHNKMGVSSIILLALVDANCRFIYVDIGCTGSTNFADAFAQCSLKRVLDNAAKNLPKDKMAGRRTLPFVIAADESFRLEPHVMVPFIENEPLSRHKQIFNNRLSRAREVVDRAFDILFNRFKVFSAVKSLRVENVEVVTMACCVLHNFFLDHDENYKRCFEPMTIGTKSPPQAVDVYYESVEAERIRHSFMAYLNEEISVGLNISF